MAKEFAFTRDTTLSYYLGDGYGPYEKLYKKGETIFGEETGSNGAITKIEFTAAGGYEKYKVDFTPEWTAVFKRIAGGENLPVEQMPVLIWKDAYNKASAIPATGPAHYADDEVMDYKPYSAGTGTETANVSTPAGLKKYLTGKNLLIAGSVMMIIFGAIYLKNKKSV